MRAARAHGGIRIETAEVRPARRDRTGLLAELPLGGVERRLALLNTARRKLGRDLIDADAKLPHTDIFSLLVDGRNHDKVAPCIVIERRYRVAVRHAVSCLPKVDPSVLPDNFVLQFFPTKILVHRSSPLFRFVRSTPAPTPVTRHPRFHFTAFRPLPLSQHELQPFARIQ